MAPWLACAHLVLLFGGACGEQATVASTMPLGGGLSEADSGLGGAIPLAAAADGNPADAMSLLQVGLQLQSRLDLREQQPPLLQRDKPELSGSGPPLAVPLVLFVASMVSMLGASCAAGQLWASRERQAKPGPGLPAASEALAGDDGSSRTSGAGEDDGTSRANAKVCFCGLALVGLALQCGALLCLVKAYGTAPERHLEFPALQYWSLNERSPRPDGLYELVQLSDGCHISIPNHPAELDMTSYDLDTAQVSFNNTGVPTLVRFMWGECVRPMPGVLSLATLPGARNPSMIHVPDELKRVVPRARWLMLAGQTFDAAAAHLLDESFEVLQTTVVGPLDSFKLDVDPTVWDGLYQDVRLFHDRDGTLMMAFVPYVLQETPYNLTFPDSWLFRESAAPLRLSLDANGKLSARMNVSETGVFASIDGENADGYVRKNLMFFNDPETRQPYAVDWLADPLVGKVNTTPLDNRTYFKPFLAWEFGYSLDPRPQPLVSPWPRTSSGTEWEPSGNANLIWIDEQGFFLGVGHHHYGYGEEVAVERKLGRTAPYGHHYAHHFFTMSRDTEHPFKLLGVSPEFCLPAGSDPNDCEVVQFVSSLTRVGSRLLVAYGVMDVTSRIATVDLATILATVRQLKYE